MRKLPTKNVLPSVYIVDPGLNQGLHKGLFDFRHLPDADVGASRHDVVDHLATGRGAQKLDPQPLQALAVQETLDAEETEEQGVRSAHERQVIVRGMVLQAGS